MNKSNGDNSVDLFLNLWNKVKIFYYLFIFFAGRKNHFLILKTDKGIKHFPLFLILFLSNNQLVNEEPNSC